MFTIWILAKQESYLAAGDRFNLAKSTAHGIVKEITNILVDLLPNYVRWPDARMYEIISTVFKRRSHGILGVVGIIDECHIPCKAPIDNPNDFYNRKANCHSLTDRSMMCFQCGSDGHRAAECRLPPKCPVCAGRGLPSRHRTGASDCVPYNGRGQAPNRDDTRVNSEGTSAGADRGAPAPADGTDRIWR
ncbi:hypothetical protein ALC57_07917 [Trachymyrmex cornetzi]|uniref:CCHC-type domain-containing protein n=1 Tax=Trachymyrmex cornetzi TaxID=471704 RepID=A0A151J7G2_9HYME|nr:hypothetical protein ALC57_07917 [Trachymyrmex cornetzi]